MRPQVALRAKLFVAVTAHKLTHVVVASVNVTLKAVGSAELFPAFLVWANVLHRLLIDNNRPGCIFTPAFD